MQACAAASWALGVRGGAPEGRPATDYRLTGPKSSLGSPSFGGGSRLLGREIQALRQAIEGFRARMLCTSPECL